MLYCVAEARFVRTRVFVVSVALVGSVVSAAPAWAQVAASISAAKIVESRSGGFKFPDGTVQSTAAASEAVVEGAVEGVQGLSVYQGLYDNRIRDFTHSVAFVEVCFKGGSILSDQNDAGTSTVGGDCAPGDVGWILEADNRSDADWTSAKATCLQQGMRLPEVFEFQFSCRNAMSIGLTAGVDRPEWMGNTPEFFINSELGITGSVVTTGSIGDCDTFGIGFVGRDDGNISMWAFRCAL